MIKNKFTHLSFLFLICVYAIGIQAQVTIGKAEKPVSGALLDLKNLDTPGPGGSTANKGMMLPRVELTTMNKLYPMLPAGYDPVEDAKHNGLVVFNMGTSDLELCLGIYVWDSQKWNRVPEPCNNSRWSSTSLLFYKSALAAKSISLDLSRDDAKVTWTHDGAIPWVSGTGFPQNETRKITKTFSFHPTENNTGADRVSNVTATVNSNGEISSETITITQLNREMLYALTPTTFAAKGQTHAITANGEASVWSATISSTNPATMISGLTNNTNRPNAGSMNITFADNPTWAERIAKLNITSTNTDFKGREVEVKQSAAAPALERTSGGTISLASSQNVTFNTNAQWQFASIAGNYANVVGSASLSGTTIAAATTQGTTTPVTQRATSVAFNPSTNNDPVAGNYTTTVRFTALNTSPQTAPAPFDVVMNRTVPARLDYVSIAPANNATIARYQGKATANYKSNAQWQAVPSLGTTQTRSAAAYAQNALTATFTDNATWNTRAVNLVIRNSTNATVATYNYTQAAYDLNYASHTFAATIPTTATTALLRFKTTNGSAASSYKARATGMTDVTANIPASNAANSAIQGANITIAAMPNNATGWSDRTISFDLVRGSSGATTTNVLQLTQKAFTLNGSNNSVPGTIPRTGGTYNINTTTSTITPNFRVKVTADGTGDLWTSGYAVVGVRSVFIPASSTIDRTIRVYIAREHKGGANTPEWVQVYTATQEGQMVRAGNIYVDRDFYGPIGWQAAETGCTSRGVSLPMREQLTENKQALANLGQSFWNVGDFLWTTDINFNAGIFYLRPYVYNYQNFIQDGGFATAKREDLRYYRCVKRP